MAGLDGTGPRGKGPMTGKTRGYCAGTVSEMPLYRRGRGQMERMGQNNRRRARIDRGSGRCMSGRFDKSYQIENAEYLLDSKQSLEDQKLILEERLNKINEELRNSNDR